MKKHNKNESNPEKRIQKVESRKARIRKDARLKEARAKTLQSLRNKDPGFRSRVNDRKAKQDRRAARTRRGQSVQEVARVVGCNLDEQAKELEVYTEQYARLSRKKRKVINGKAYKDLQLNAA